MTTEAVMIETAPAHIGIRWLLAAVPIALCFWLMILAAVMRFGGAPAALVMFPAPGFLSQLPQGVSLTSVGPYSVTVRGGQGLVTALYDAGAVLVLPAGISGCLPQGTPI